ncbi:hypothetical protein CKJ81_04720 [Corynebacterium hadale]|uniref:Uncharacterized protein n=2 Tax=Corynebacterium TaxID=1716 RepID=A0A269PFL0_9CORY|nr:hypothetical protein CIG21_01985 [Corynebacterium hadale]PAT06264.1 hypothetical protein CKJ81_04720 [Corynebacterium hadale]PAT13690.1 hypothetical protein CKJ83_02350 [Corynebacterium hadale]RMD20109.1 hypothetical protein EAW56_04115 [Corynebacterium gottingense]
MLVLRVLVDFSEVFFVEVFFSELDFSEAFDVLVDDDFVVSSSSSSSALFDVEVDVDFDVVGDAVVLVAGKSITGSARRASSPSEDEQPANTVAATSAARTDWVRLRFTSRSFPATMNATSVADAA